MWSAPLHDADFVGKVLAHVEENKDIYGTSARMKGMLTIAKEVGLDLRPKFWTLFAQSFYTGATHSILLYTKQSGQFLPLRNTILGRCCVRTTFPSNRLNLITLMAVLLS